MQVCKRCLFNEKTPGISFNDDGVCNYCELHDELERQYPTDKNKIFELADKIKSKRKGKYDVIIGICGGCDSSSMLYIAKKIMGLNPLAVHFDNGFNSEVSENNIRKMLIGLDINFIRRQVDQTEYNDIYKSFFKAGLPDIEAVTDMALMSTLYEEAYKHKVKYIFVGHSFRTEGISPLGYSYMDSGYIRSVQKRFGTKKIKTLPELRFFTFLKYMFAGIKRIRPLYYIHYDKKAMKSFLSRKFHWEWYGGLHKESVITDYVKNYWIWRRYKTDKSITEVSGLVRSGSISREDGEKLLSNKPSITEETRREAVKLLGFNPNRYIMRPHRTYKDFKNYKWLFKLFRPLFWIFLKLDRIPLSFYTKYCK